MLVDPLPVKALSLSGGSAITVAQTDTFALVDLAPGKSVRKVAPMVTYGNPGQLTISHSVSKENGSIPTDRLLVRLDISGLGPSSTESGDLKAFAYLVVGVPRGAYDATPYPFTPLPMIQSLIGAVAVSPTAANLSQTNLLRMLAGEP